MNTSFFDNHLAQTTLHPLNLEIERAEGIYIIDKQGRKYIDMVAGIAVSNAGHSHPRIVQAVKNQVEKYMHVMVYGEFHQEAPKKLASLLTKHLPSQLNTCYFVNSGTEANEAALKLAKRLTGRTRIVSCKASYHGSTHGSLSVSGNEMKKFAFRPLLPDIHFMRFNAAEDLNMIDSDTAAVIVETIQGDAGVRIPDLSWMQQLRKKCTDTGAQLILDEIQCGMGRAGTIFAFEQFGISPDILTLGKALGGGMPIGAFISSREKMMALCSHPPLGHITTFGGHPVPAAAGAAAFEMLMEEGHYANAAKKGFLLSELLRVHPKVKEIRYRGLMFAIDMGDAHLVQRVVEYCLKKGLISFWFLSCPDSFRLAPPLTISEEEVRTAASIILEAFDAA
jgi:acetylornithine/succinyldiaminopimelate/putrescine aminotransferase